MKRKKYTKLQFNYTYLIIFFFVSLFLMELNLFTQKNGMSSLPQTVEYPKIIPLKKDVWVFIMAGQSNMAGRAAIEPLDTLPNERILTINAKGEMILAKEPLHFYEPGLQGLDAGFSFASSLIKSIPVSASILLIPASIGGSSINQWLGDSLHRGIRLLSNFKSKIQLGIRYGIIKGILWHQGEGDIKRIGENHYQKKLFIIHNQFRKYAHNRKLP